MWGSAPLASTASKSHLFCVSREGTQPSLVFLHGLGGTHRYWQFGGNLSGFRQRVVLPDLFGFGDSPKPWCRYTLPRHLEKLHELLCNEPQMVLVGHSMGATLALAYTARWPEAVRGLVLLSLPHFGDVGAAYRWLRRFPHGWILTNMYASAIACVITRRVTKKLLPLIVRDYPREVLDDIVKHNMFSSTTSLWEVVYRHDVAGDIAALPAHIPVVCVHGDADKAAPLQSVEALCAGSASWQLVVLPKVDHHPWLRAPLECVEAVQATIKRATAVDGSEMNDCNIAVKTARNGQ